MIDKEKIQKAIDNKSCINIYLTCSNCPVFDKALESWECGTKNSGNIRSVANGLRPRAIRIMKEWLEANK